MRFIRQSPPRVGIAGGEGLGVAILGAGAFAFSGSPALPSSCTGGVAFSGGQGGVAFNGQGGVALSGPFGVLCPPAGLACLGAGASDTVGGGRFGIHFLMYGDVLEDAIVLLLCSSLRLAGIHVIPYGSCLGSWLWAPS